MLRGFPHNDLIFLVLLGMSSGRLWTGRFRRVQQSGESDHHQSVDRLVGEVLMKGHHDRVFCDFYQSRNTEESPADRGPHPALRLLGQEVSLEQDGGVVGDRHHSEVALVGAEALGGEFSRIEGLMDGFEGVLDGPPFLVESEDPQCGTLSSFPLEEEGVALEIGDDPIEEGGVSVVDPSLFRPLDSSMGAHDNQSDRVDSSWEEQYPSGVEDCSGSIDVLPISRGCVSNGLLDSTEIRFHFSDERVRPSQQEVEICHTQQISPIDSQQIDASKDLFYLGQQGLEMVFAVDIATVEDLVKDQATEHPYTPQVAISPLSLGVLARLGFLPLLPFGGSRRSIYIENPQLPRIESLFHGLDLDSDQLGVDPIHLSDLPSRTPVQKAVQRLLTAKPRHPQHRCQDPFRLQLIVNVTDPLDPQNGKEDQGNTEISHRKLLALMRQTDLGGKGFFEVKHLQQKHGHRVEKAIRRQRPRRILHLDLPHFPSASLAPVPLPLQVTFSRVRRIPFGGMGSGGIWHGNPLLSLEVEGKIRAEYSPQDKQFGVGKPLKTFHPSLRNLLTLGQLQNHSETAIPQNPL